MIDYNEAFRACFDYFSGDELAVQVFLGKYALRNEKGDLQEKTPDDMHKRLAKEFARIERKYENPLSEEEIYEYLKDFKYIIPQGSPMAGIGNPYQKVSLSNCFVIESPYDSYAGILKTDQEEAQIMKRRGGVGFDISTIRPKGLATSNSSKTTDGIGVFMERFSNTCREVGQGGRRGALMLTISVHHPEIRTFINIKKDKKKVTGANVSIRLSDEFLEAVEKKESFELRWPVDSKNPKISEKIDAEELWTEIIEAAHSSAEPGLLFWDHIKKWTPADAYESVGFGSTSTNPCFSGDTFIAVADGRSAVTIKQLAEEGKDVPVYSINPETGFVEIKTGRNPRITGRNQTLLRIHLDNGSHLDVTPNHKMLLRNGTPKRADELEVGDKLPRFKKEISVSQLSKLCTQELNYEGADRDTRLSKTLKSMIKQGYKSTIVGNQVFVSKLCETCGSSFQVEHTKREISFCSHSCSLVYINKNESIAKKRTSTRNIIAYNNWNEIKQAGNDYNHKVVRVERLADEHTVYNITVDDNHTVGIITKEVTSDGSLKSYDGIYTAQCGELIICPDDSCRLLLINTLSFVEYPFTKNPSFNFEKFEEVVQVAQRLMDDLVDLEIECVDKIIEKIKEDPEPEHIKQTELSLWKRIRDKAVKGRRTGLGVTAIGDTLAALNIRYGSKESIESIEEIYKSLGLNSYRSSVKLAKERGVFPVYNYELEKDHPFINRIMDLDPELKKSWRKYGRRNIANTTTAPAGSVSILTQTTSGIEPAFLLSYKRRKKINQNDEESRVDFVDDLGDKWQEYTVYHPGFKKWQEVSGKMDPKESPYHLATSNDIDWSNKVKAQAAAQKWICHSISNTTNVPKNTSVETIKEIYMTGWRSGTKGVTVYRDGCRDGVLVSETSSSVEGFVENHAPKRPKVLPCDIYHMQVRGEKWNFFVGLYDNKPFEVFAGRSIHVQLPRSRKTGTIEKNGTYNLKTGDGDNELVIQDLASVFENSAESAFTRTISLALRHGAPIQYIVEQIEKGADKDNEMFSLAKGLMRVLKGYIKDGTKPSLKQCPSCNSGQLSYQEGCITCTSCGYSKCG